MYLGLEDKGSVFSILKNWPERRVKAICLTDGQRVGNLGDLGVQVWMGGWLCLEQRSGGSHCAGLLRTWPPAVPPPLAHPPLPCPAPPPPQAIGVPIARLALYTACGGIVPSACLPITVDAGTDNEALLQVRLRVGWGPARWLQGGAGRGRAAGLCVSPLQHLLLRMPAPPPPPSPQDPIYVGGKHRRVRGDAYFDLVDELFTAVRRRYGSSGARAGSDCE